MPDLEAIVGVVPPSKNLALIWPLVCYRGADWSRRHLMVGASVAGDILAAESPSRSSDAPVRQKQRQNEKAWAIDDIEPVG